MKHYLKKSAKFWGFVLLGFLTVGMVIAFFSDGDKVSKKSEWQEQRIQKHIQAEEQKEIM